MFNVKLQDALDVRRQLVDYGEVAKDRGAVGYNDGPDRRRKQNGFPRNRHVLGKVTFKLNYNNYSRTKIE